MRLRHGPGPPPTLWCSERAARALGLQRRFDEAHAELDAVHASEGATVEVEVRLRLERGRAQLVREPRRAIPCFVQRWISLGRRGSMRWRLMRRMLGIAERGETGSDGHAGRSRWLRRRATRSARWRGSLLNNLGWTRFRSGDATEALRCFQAALEARIETGHPKDTDRLLERRPRSAVPGEWARLRGSACPGTGVRGGQRVVRIRSRGTR